MNVIYIKNVAIVVGTMAVVGFIWAAVDGNSTMIPGLSLGYRPGNGHP